MAQFKFGDKLQCDKCTYINCKETVNCVICQYELMQNCSTNEEQLERIAKRKLKLDTEEIEIQLEKTKLEDAKKKLSDEKTILDEKQTNLSREKEQFDLQKIDLRSRFSDLEIKKTELMREILESARLDESDDQLTSNSDNNNFF